MSAEPARRTGRPDQQAAEELVQQIVDTATRLFIQQGYAATSIEQIAAAAGSGKQTIYRHFTSKASLFTEVINRQGQRLTDMAQAARATSADPIDVLREIGRLLLDFMLEPQMVGLFRVLVAETERFPETTELVLKQCMGPFEDMLLGALADARDAGSIRFDDIDQTRLQMVGLLTAGPMHKMLVGQNPFAGRAERDAYFQSAWHMFLHGVG